MIAPVPSNTPASGRHPIRRHLRRWWWAWYLLALLASHLVQSGAWGPGAKTITPPTNQRTIKIPLAVRSGVLPDRTMNLAILSWGPPDSEHPPVVLLHGSPGSAANFNRLAPALATLGYRVLAPDLPGYGDSTRDLPDYSPRAQSRAIGAMLDELGIERAHIVGWSIGGGVAINLADLAPERLASLTLMASIGVQETEGSGSWFFEHVKYGVGYLGLVVGAEAVPHFGLLGPRRARHTFIRQFWDMDQRPYRAIIERLTIPTLILHGRHDFLTAAWAAERHHALMPSSRLVMLDASHFLPFLQAEETASHLAQHFASAQDGSFQPGALILAPARDRAGLAGVIDDALVWSRDRWWGWQAIGVALIAFACAGIGWPTLAFAVAGWLIASVTIDFGVASTGLVGAGLVRAIRSARRGDRAGRPRTPAGWLALPIVIVLWLLPARLLSPMITVAWFDRVGTIGLLAGLVVVWMLLRVARLAWTADGRARLLGGFGTIRRHEFWPSLVFYLPLVPWIAWLALRHRGVMLFTRVNPGIGEGGGVVGESKIDILRALAPAGDAILPAVLIEPGPDAAARARELIATTPELGGYPVVLKPNRAERGAGVALARTPDDLDAYFRRITMEVVAQRFHPGPEEFGVLWARLPDAAERAPAGRIISITRKTRARVVGDGVRTLRQLLRRDPRLRCRFAWWTSGDAPGLDRPLDEVVPDGQPCRLGAMGNHSSGGIFSDGGDLHTPELEAAIDRLARAMLARDGSPDGFDFGRFDIRCDSEESFRRGQGLAVIELNGTFSESTNLYDPDRSFFFAYRVLYRQWATLFALGAWRRSIGSPGLGPIGFLRLVFGHRATQRATIRPHG